MKRPYSTMKPRMKHLPKAFLAGIASLSLGAPALAHMGSAAAPHVHAGDGWGLLAVAALTGVAAWLGRRGR
jgi:hypothetical protein